MDRKWFLRTILIAGCMIAVALPGLSPGQTPAVRAEVALPASIGADARDALARMGKTLSAKQFSYRTRTLRSYVGPNGELLHIEHTTKTIYRRPDRLLVSVTGDDGSIEIFYDGKNLVLYTVEAKQYINLPIKGDIENALNLLGQRTGTDYPLADLLDDNPEEAVTSGFTEGGQVGTALIDGVRCRHFYFEQAAEDLDVELWLEDNERALPRRFVVTYRAYYGYGYGAGAVAAGVAAGAVVGAAATAPYYYAQPYYPAHCYPPYPAPYPEGCPY